MENENEPNKRFERRPNFDMHTKLSRDGKYWIITRTETWILPRKYLDVIAQNHSEDHKQIELVFEQPEKKGRRDANGNG